jgi:beta,beta-carotene 9',10'-dioxygenase
MNNQFKGAEDVGAVLSVVFDSQSGTSFLLVLDGQSFTEIARTRLPQHIPFGFHGQFFGEK